MNILQPMKKLPEKRLGRNGFGSRSSDSAKCHLPIGYAADLTPVVAAREAGASWNAGGRAERVWELLCAVDFLGSEGIRRQGRQGVRPERLPDTSKDTPGGGQLVLGERATNQ